MRSEPNTTSRTFGVTEGFCGDFRVESVGVPLERPKSRAIDVRATRQGSVYMLMEPQADVLWLQMEVSEF